MPQSSVRSTRLAGQTASKRKHSEVDAATADVDSSESLRRSSRCNGRVDYSRYFLKSLRVTQDEQAGTTRSSKHQRPKVKPVASAKKPSQKSQARSTASDTASQTIKRQRLELDLVRAAEKRLKSVHNRALENSRRLEAEIDTLHQQQDKNSAHVEALNRELEQSKSALDEAVKKEAETTSAKETAMKTTEDTLAECRRLHNKLETKKRQLADVNAEKTKIDHFSRSHEQQAAYHYEALKAAKEENRTLKTQLGKAKGEATRNETAKAKAQTDHDELEQTNTQLIRNIESLRTNEQTLQTSLRSRETAANDAQLTITALRDAFKLSLKRGGRAMRACQDLFLAAKAVSDGEKTRLVEAGKAAEDDEQLRLIEAVGQYELSLAKYTEG